MPVKTMVRFSGKLNFVGWHKPWYLEQTLCLKTTEPLLNNQITKLDVRPFFFDRLKNLDGKQMEQESSVEEGYHLRFNSSSDTKLSENEIKESLEEILSSLIGCEIYFVIDDIGLSIKTPKATRLREPLLTNAL